ncbi:hypothetical protein CXB51_028061 [Gossypium anomalum]|uniref:Uncharacterized protein n=1 Tax=Gossypium anomalum TaxID=47600 RepID=A0A8J5XXK5_9ROSI|nr:hypothetical protein CXB51_028061 [Gossypium anomalum]
MRSQPWCSPKSQTWRSNLKYWKTLPPNHHSSSTKESGYTCCLIGLYHTDYSIFRTDMESLVLVYLKQVGVLLVPKAGVRGVSTRRINAVKNLNSNNLRNDMNLESDLRSEALTLIAQSNMEGKVYWFLTFSGHFICISLLVIKSSATHFLQTS